MGDGFHWTRVTTKQLRFLYEEVTLQPAPPQMHELVARLGAGAAAQPSAHGQNDALRNDPSARNVDAVKENWR